ncbi:MAG TPA: DUF748 domain-containing protein [Deltaproteobacteria bacterium]|nr:DUF748 domain-containing protein [Deltaproteobacteria bacterium]
MSAASGKRLRLIILLIPVILVAGGYAGFRLAVAALKERVVEALGPDSEIRSIRADRSGVHIEGLKIRGSNGWPAGDTLRAEHVTVVPGIRSLLSGQYRIRSITIEKPYLSMLRTKDGKLLAVPSLLAEKGKKGPENAPRRRVSIGRITLSGGVIEFFDETIPGSRRKIRLEQIQATIQDVDTPGLSGRSRFEISSVVKGTHGEGCAGLTGWVEIATKDSSVKATMRSVDLTTFQPYITRAGDAQIQKGTLDLDLQSEIRGNRLKAPGKATISSLRLAPGKGLWGTFMGMPRSAVLSMLKSKGDRITLSFVLEGDIGNPASPSTKP